VLLISFSVEGFGVEIPKRCGACKGCKECGNRATQITFAASKELEQIEKGLTLNVKEKNWVAEYPYICDPMVLRNNHSQALACLVKS